MCGWFIMNVMYNVSLKKVQLVFHMPATVSAVSLLGGIPWVLLLWATGLRKAPKIGAHGWRVLAPIGAAHAVGHAGAVVAIGAGGVSFAQTLKAAEPLFTVALSYLVLGTVFRWQVYASLLPVLVGLLLASLQELAFSARALCAGLASNAAFATRAVLGKRTMDTPVGENLDAPNLYAS